MKWLYDFLTGKTGKELANYAIVENWDVVINTVRLWTGLPLLIIVFLFVISYWIKIKIPRWLLVILMVVFGLPFTLTFF